MALVTDISCVLPRPDIGQLHTQLRTELSKRLLGGAPVLPMSAEDVIAAIMAGAVNLSHGFVTQVLKENNPATMCCDNLMHYGAIHGMNLRGSTRSKGYLALTGTASAPIPSDIRFTQPDYGLEYKLDPAVTFNPTMLDPQGVASVRIVAALAGAQYDQPTGTVLTVSSTLPGIDGIGTVVGGGLVGGSDDETCEEFRVRVIAAERSGAVSTNQAWYLQQANTYPGVSKICLDECQQCCDPLNITLYPFMEGVYGDATTAPYGVPPQAELDAMTAWMFGTPPGMGMGLAPVGIRGSFQGARPTFLTIEIYCLYGCPAAAHDRMVVAVRHFLAAQYCVGSALCKEQIRAVCYAAAGIDVCFAGVAFLFDATLYRQDQAWAFLDCEHFVVLTDVVLSQAPPPSRPQGVVADNVTIIGTGLASDELEVNLLDAGEDA